MICFIEDNRLRKIYESLVLFVEELLISPHTEGYSSQHHDDHSLSRKFAMLKEKAVLVYNVEITENSGWFKSVKNCYSFYNVKVSGKSENVKTGEKFLRILHKLIVEENYL